MTKIMGNWETKLIRHKGEPRIAIYFDNDRKKNDFVKSIAGSKWSRTLHAWHIPDTDENRGYFEVVSMNGPVMSEEIRGAIADFKDWLRSRRYSENTVGTYSEALKSFLLFFHGKTISAISNQDVIEYNNRYILQRGLSASYQNQVVNAIKLFFRIIKKAEIDIAAVHRPKRSKSLPSVLSKEEVKRLISVPVNQKHRMMLSLLYSCGLRSGELLALQPSHIDSERCLILVKNGKGKKDRIVPLSSKILGMLRDYYRVFRPKRYLFEGQIEGEAYDARSLQQVLKAAVKRAGINKLVTLHWLRHSYATHLLESGTDLRYIQEILGHSSSKTTEIYTHVSTKSIQQIKSPFDDL